MAKNSKNRSDHHRHDNRFVTTVKITPQAAAKFIEKQAQKLVPRAVRGVQYTPRIPVAQNNVKWSGKQMGNTKFSMFTKKTGLNTLMSNKDGKAGFRIPALIAILAIVIGGGGYWAYDSLSSTEWGRMSSGAEVNTNKWLENVSNQRNESAPATAQKSKVTESYKTWGSDGATKSVSASKATGASKRIVGAKKHSGKSLAKHSSKKHKGKKFTSGKKSKSKGSNKYAKGKSGKKHKLVSGKSKRSKAKHVTMTSARR